MTIEKLENLVTDLKLLQQQGGFLYKRATHLLKLDVTTHNIDLVKAFLQDHK